MRFWLCTTFPTRYQGRNSSYRDGTISGSSLSYLLYCGSTKNINSLVAVFTDMDYSRGTLRQRLDQLDQFSLPTLFMFHYYILISRQGDLQITLVMVLQTDDFAPLLALEQNWQVGTCEAFQWRVGTRKPEGTQVVTYNIPIRCFHRPNAKTKPNINPDVSCSTSFIRWTRSRRPQRSLWSKSVVVKTKTHFLDSSLSIDSAHRRYRNIFISGYKPLKGKLTELMYSKHFITCCIWVKFYEKPRVVNHALQFHWCFYKTPTIFNQVKFSSASTSHCNFWTYQKYIHFEIIYLIFEKLTNFLTIAQKRKIS